MCACFPKTPERQRLISVPGVEQLSICIFRRLCLYPNHLSTGGLKPNQETITEFNANGGRGRLADMVNSLRYRTAGS